MFTRASPTFADYVYDLYSDELVIGYQDPETYLDQDTTISTDCGPLSLEFFNSDGSLIDERLFRHDKNENRLVVLYNEDVKDVGTYNLMWRAWYADQWQEATGYPENTVSSSETFSIKIVDLCDTENSDLLESETPDRCRNKPPKWLYMVPEWMAALTDSDIRTGEDRIISLGEPTNRFDQRMDV